MIPIMTRAQMQAYDRQAIEGCAVPGLVLMENAGRGAAELIAAVLAEQHDRDGSEPPPDDARAAVIVCGPGNNGGDGFVVARQLGAWGWPVRVFLAGAIERVRGDARANLDAYQGLGGKVELLSADEADLGALGAALEQAAVAVDGLFGTGLDRPIEGYRAQVIEILNRASCPRVALDIPSGIDSDTGGRLGVAVQAEYTVTFGHHKIGMLTGEGLSCAGRVMRQELGIPDRAIVATVGQAGEIIEAADVAGWLGTRPADAHKYQAGSVLIVAGRPGKVGASLLCARAALRSGAGIVTIGTWPEAADALDGRVAEVMTARLDPDRLDETLAEALHKRKAVAIGPGVGLDEQARELVERVVLGWPGPVAVDADAITHFAGRPEALREAAGPRVLTPHAGELARLLAIRAAEVEQDRVGRARQAAAQSGCIVVLKGRNTIIAAADGRLWVCTRGNAALATAGSGDALTGMLGALLCAMPPAEAACAGVFLHAASADRWQAEHGADRGMMAGDVIDRIPSVMASLRD